MLKFLHLACVLLSILSFVARIILSETHPSLLKHRVVSIAPHVINALLLLSGVMLVFHGDWLNGGATGWLGAKVLALFAYVGLGMVALKARGNRRWLAFAGAMACFVYIGVVAATKNPFFFW